MKYLDLTRAFSSAMPVFPGDRPVKLEEYVDSGNNVVHFHLNTGMHVGTHMDGPLHMIPGGRKLSDISVDRFVAHGHLIDARDRKEIDASLLAGRHIVEDDCVLLYTGFDQKFGDPSFYTNYPVLTEAFAQELVRLKIKFVGMDTPSPDRAPYDVHRILLREEILIMEGLTNLSALLSVKNFEVFALPAKFEAEAAPVRVIARI